MGRGRPRGSQNRKTAWLKELEGHGDAIIKQCMVLALKGDRTALRLCMERLLPPCEPSGQRFKLPAVTTVADVGTALRAVLQEMARGRITARDGEAVASVLETRRRLAETEELHARLRVLEQRVPEDRKPSKDER